jgi:hypothetical protein
MVSNQRFHACINHLTSVEQNLLILSPNILASTRRFARIRLSLRFELLCLTTPAMDASGNIISDEQCPSVGLTKIQKLSRLGAHEDPKQEPKNPKSAPDLVGYFGNMLI